MTKSDSTGVLFPPILVKIGMTQLVENAWFPKCANFTYLYRYYTVSDPNPLTCLPGLEGVQCLLGKVRESGRVVDTTGHHTIVQVHYHCIVNLGVRGGGGVRGWE